MKIIYLLLIVFVVIAAVFLIWYLRGPSTDLVDASGRGLTAGDELDEGADAFDDEFDEAQRLMEAEEFGAAKTVLLALIEESERDGEACMLLSDATRELNDVDSAVDYGLKAVELLPDSAGAHLAYAKALGMQMFKNMTSVTGMLGAMKTTALLKEHLVRVIELDPDDVEARTMLTFYFMAPWPIGDIDKAIALCGEIEARDPVLGKQMRAVCLKQDGRTEEAIALCLECIEAYPEENAFHATLADIYVEQERLDEADAEYGAARRGDKDDTYYRALYYQGLMRLNNDFETERAVELFDEFIAGNPRGEGVPPVTYACLRMGNALEKLGRLEEAREAYESSFDHEPDFAPAVEALQSLKE